MTSPADPAIDAIPAPIVRPTFGRFIWYCFQGSLPAENHSWVLHDVTCRTWILRHFARWTMIVVPVFVLLLAFMPVAFGIRLFSDLAICGAIYMFALVNTIVDTDRRAVRAGYSFTLPGSIRSTRSVDRQHTQNFARRERLAERRSRRR